MKTSENNNSKADPNQEDMIELKNLYKLKVEPNDALIKTIH